MSINQEAGNNRAPLYLRSYQNRQETSILPDIKIWQAGRATSAAPSSFTPIKVDNYTLVDGGLGDNNPLGWYEVPSATMGHGTFSVALSFLHHIPIQALDRSPWRLRPNPRNIVLP